MFQRQAITLHRGRIAVKSKKAKRKIKSDNAAGRAEAIPAGSMREAELVVLTGSAELQSVTSGSTVGAAACGGAGLLQLQLSVEQLSGASGRQDADGHVHVVNSAVAVQPGVWGQGPVSAVEHT